MAGKVKAVPDGTHTITAHLSVREATKAIEFYQKAFGAHLLHVHKTPDGKVMHATLKIGDSSLMLADEFPGMGTKSAQTLGSSPVVLNIYVEDVDTLLTKRLRPALRSPCLWPISFGAIVTARSSTPLATRGHWAHTLKMSRRKRWNAAPTPSLARCPKRPARRKAGARYQVPGNRAAC